MMRTLALLSESSRRVAVLVASRVVPGLDMVSADRRFRALAPATQRGLSLAVSGWMLAAALVAAKFGPLGLAIYFAAAILLAL